MSELVLAIDAGSPISSAALASHGRLLAEAAAESRSGTRLLALIGECFRATERAAGELTAVVAVAGPGSFTGVRITLATALGLAPGIAGEGPSSLPLRTISTLAALALHAPPESDRLLAAVDALRGELFVQPFVRDGGTWKPEREPSRIAGDALATLGGPPAPLYSHRELRFAWPHGIRCVSQLAARVACAASDARTADSPLFSGRVRPIYLRDAATTPPRSLSR